MIRGLLLEVERGVHLGLTQFCASQALAGVRSERIADCGNHKTVCAAIPGNRRAHTSNDHMFSGRLRDLDLAGLAFLSLG